MKEKLQFLLEPTILLVALWSIFLPILDDFSINKALNIPFLIVLLIVQIIIIFLQSKGKWFKGQRRVMGTGDFVLFLIIAVMGYYAITRENRTILYLAFAIYNGFWIFDIYKDYKLNFR